MSDHLEFPDNFMRIFGFERVEDSEMDQRDELKLYENMGIEDWLAYVDKLKCCGNCQHWDSVDWSCYHPEEGVRNTFDDNEDQNYSKREKCNCWEETK